MGISSIALTCRVEDDKDFRFIVTPYSASDYHTQKEDMVAIHGFGLDTSIYCNVEQAEGLVEELKKGIKSLKAARLKREIVDG